MNKNITKEDFFKAVEFVSCSRDREYITQNALIRDLPRADWKEIGTVDEFRVWQNKKFYVINENGCYMLFKGKKFPQLNIFS